MAKINKSLLVAIALVLVFTSTSYASIYPDLFIPSNVRASLAGGILPDYGIVVHWPHIRTSVVGGTWRLLYTNSLNVADAVVFRNDGTGTSSIGSIRQNFSWFMEDSNTVVVNNGHMMIAYTILQLTDTTLTYEAHIPWMGLVRMTYAR